MCVSLIEVECGGCFVVVGESGMCAAAIQCALVSLELQEFSGVGGGAVGTNSFAWGDKTGPW